MTAMDPTAAGATYETITVSPVTKAIGAEVEGLDLRQELSEQQVAEVRAALLEHLVLFFREQDLTDDQHIGFARRFGEPNIYPPNRARGVLEPLEWIEDDANSPPKADLWHTDVAFAPEPPDIAVLNMRDAPVVGGDTMWASLYAAYDALSPALQALVSGLQIDVHPGSNMERTITALHGAEVFAKVAEEFQGCHQPLVRVHPETARRALYLCGAYMRGVVGLSPYEGQALLDLLGRGLDDPNVSCRWRWRRHDLVMWDERCTNHRALSDHYPAHRLVRRCTVGVAPPLGPNQEVPPS